MSQFTKSGLSKPFACCGHWNICEMGKKIDLCVYKEIDSETMINCRVYQKNHQKNYQKVKEEQTLDKAFALFDKLFG